MDQKKKKTFTLFLKNREKLQSQWRAAASGFSRFTFVQSMDCNNYPRRSGGLERNSSQLWESHIMGAIWNVACSERWATLHACRTEGACVRMGKAIIGVPSHSVAGASHFSLTHATHSRTQPEWIRLQFNKLREGKRLGSSSPTVTPLCLWKRLSKILFFALSLFCVIELFNVKQGVCWSSIHVWHEKKMIVSRTSAEGDLRCFSGLLKGTGE